MDRVTLTRKGDGAPAKETPAGWSLDAEHEWVVEGPAASLHRVCEALGRVAQRLSGSVALLRFGNAVGRYPAGPLGQLRVHSGKWTDTHYADMLSDIARSSAALPFQAGAASALPYARTERVDRDLLYHAFVWLRHSILDREDAPLIGALYGILAAPHRRMVNHARRVPAEQAGRLSPRSLDEIAAGRWPLRRVQKGRGIMGGDVFPVEVREQVARPSSDTPENRFIKAFLSSCGHIVAAMRRHMDGETSALSHRVRAQCVDIEGALAPIQRHRLWEDVGEMFHFPASSTVLQRRWPYREVLRHHVLMGMGTKALPLQEAEVAQLLEVKDIARLYELWSAFAVIDALRHALGAPMSARSVHLDDLSASVKSGLLAKWSDGTELAYNATFTSKKGFHGCSWSRTLRPDISLWIPSGPSRGLHLFDAKFRLSGHGPDGEGGVQSADLHKMHTYRDAITEARSAWVLYPGREERQWSPEGTEDAQVSGVGALPLVPGAEPKALLALLTRLIGAGGTHTRSTAPTGVLLTQRPSPRAGA